MLNAHSMSGPFLLDPAIMDDMTSDSSAKAARTADFAKRVIARDGTCLMTGALPYCQACHIVPHAKRNKVCSEYSNHSQFSFQAQYMSGVAKRRNEVVNPPLNDIDDTRNGILLITQLHGPFGDSKVAFLQVSYFAQLSFMWLN
jgi:hypothetical protein